MTETDNSTFTFVLYRYDPTLVGAILFATLFAATTSLHAYQLVRTRTWYFIPLLIGGIFEAVGYIGRALSHFNTLALSPFIMQSLLLLVAPALFAASIYMVLGRLTRFLHAEHLSLIRINWITKLFVCGDIISFTAQGAGGGIMAGGTVQSLHVGQDIIVVGLFAQLLFFGIFLIAAIVLYRRIKGTTHPMQQPEEKQNVDWRTLLYALYAASVLILVRSIFRIIEYLQGNDGFIQRHEVFGYVFDGVLMLTVMVIFNNVHPGSIISNVGNREWQLRNHEMANVDPESRTRYPPLQCRFNDSDRIE